MAPARTRSTKVPPLPPELEAWPPPWARSTAFITGIGLIVWETVIDNAEHLIVYGPAFALTGLPVARGVERLIDVIGGMFGGKATTK